MSAKWLGSEFAVEFAVDTSESWTDIRVRPERALRDDLDFIRVLADDATYRVLHMTHNGALLGEVALSGSSTGMLHMLIRELAEVIW